MPNRVDAPKQKCARYTLRMFTLISHKGARASLALHTIAAPKERDATEWRLLFIVYVQNKPNQRTKPTQSLPKNHQSLPKKQSEPNLTPTPTPGTHSIGHHITPGTAPAENSSLHELLVLLRRAPRCENLIKKILNPSGTKWFLLRCLFAHRAPEVFAAWTCFTHLNNK